MSDLLQKAVEHHRAGRLVDAERLYRSAAAAAPKNAIVHGLLGDVLHALGRDRDAEREYRLALQLNRELPTVLVNLGLVLRRQRKRVEALDLLAEAVQRFPELPEAHLNHGLILQELGRFDEAVAAERQAIAVRPDYPEAYLNLGSALHGQNRFPEAREAYETALRLRPDYAEAHYCLGLTLLDLGQLDESRAAFERALALRPAYDECRDNLAYVLQVLGRYREAAALYRQGVDRGDSPANAARFLALSSLYDPEPDHLQCYAEQRRAEDRFARPHYAATSSYANARDPERPLRIGYLTSDFRDHPVGRNLEPLLAHRDRARFTVTAYIDVASPDAMTTHLRSLVDHWSPVDGWTDGEIAERVRADAIDILVVLAGHFDRNRPLVFAYRPAPIQVSFHDLLTTGLEVVDYFIADRTVYQPRRSPPFTERVIRLPSLYVHAPFAVAPQAPRPHNSRITFGSFNNPAKVNDRVLAIWARLLRMTPNADLVLKYRNWFLTPSLQARIGAAMKAEGVDPARVRTMGERDMTADHLARYGGIDIALDTFPFSGSTTTFEALWMGVPVVTLAGDTVASRWSASMLHALRLDELVAATPDEYLEIATGLASDAARLSSLRATLHERVLCSPLVDGRLRARQIERIYCAIWRRWCRSGQERR